MAIVKITRRQLLLAGAGATVVVGAAGLWLGVQHMSDKRFRRSVDRGADFAPNVYLSVQSDSTTTIWLVRSEMGQGISTALPMIVAEEMDADWDLVRVEHAVVGDGFDYGSQFTASSASVSSMWTELRNAGAIARAMLVQAAARSWDISVEDCIVEKGIVKHPTSGKELSFGDLAERARSETAPLRPTLKKPSAFKIIGKPLRRLDLRDKVTGKAEFGLDVRLEGQLFAVLARCPTWGGQLDGYDDAKAREVSGVTDVIRLSGGVAVVAKNTYSAIQGRNALELRWKHGANAKLDNQRIIDEFDRALVRPGNVPRDDGDAEATIKKSEEIEATYRLPYLAHTPMEPLNCTARVEDGRCEIWAPTQDPDGARNLAARELGLPVEKIVVHKTFLGGGFGRRTNLDDVKEAVELSAKLKRAVQVVWTREDDIRHGRYREASLHRLRACLGSDGMPQAWSHKVVTSSEAPLGKDPPWIPLMGIREMPYTVENVRVEWSPAVLPVPTAIWRSVGHSYNVFVIECFIDELAARAKKSPLDYRLALLGNNSRLKKCVKRVAELSDFEARRKSGAYLGLAACACFGSFVAQVAEVTQVAGVARVNKVWCVVDAGVIVNPDTARAQLEGGIIFGLTAALRGKLDIERGGVVQSNFHDYPLLDMAEAPAIEVELIPSAEAPGGMGEVGVPPIAPAVANAMFSTTKRPIRALPLELRV